MFTDTIQMDT
uniref:Uncharacterized protein n=1 Tax=Anguilla anguilla TaxID=7936 RepID=A0A0E9UYH3_ANGAN